MQQTDLEIVRVVPGAGSPISRNQPAERPESKRSWLEAALGLLTSTVLHLMALVLLALILHAVPIMQRPAEIVLAPPGLGAAELDGVEFGELETRNDDGGANVVPDEKPIEPLVESNSDSIKPPAIEPVFDVTPRVATLDPVRVVPGTNVAGGQRSRPDEPNLQLNLGAALTGRSGELKQRLLGEAGGNEGSELAVQLALAWLSEHQEADGSWRLDFPAQCGGRCGGPGSKSPARNAATALALLPFLGNGHTHKDGPYAEVVGLGLQYLKENIRQEPAGGSFMDEGQMYSHGLATIAVCEALAMSQDRSLLPVARSSIDFIVAAQNVEQGGWRY